MKVLIDTNVLVSAILRDKAPERLILFIVSNPKVQWIASNSIIEEYKSVLSRGKFRLPDEIKQEWFDLIDEMTEIANVNIQILFSRDQKDAKFLECALAENIDYFITGDKDFGEAQKFVTTTIMSVTQFIQLFCDNKSNTFPE